MKTHFKPHIQNLVRYQTSEGRDLRNGLCLDRNERVRSFTPEVINDIIAHFSPNFLNASPDSNSLYEKIARNLDVPRRNIFLVAGVTEGIRILYETLTNPGENVVVLDPTYPMYSVYAKMYKVEYRRFTYNDELRPDITTLYGNIDSNTTMVMIPNPNLPIECLFSVKEIRNIAERCRENEIILVVDEAYYYFGGPTVVDLFDEHDNLVVMRSFSKAYGLAGIRLGFIVSSADNIEYLSKTRSLVESNTLSMNTAEYLLDHIELRDAHVQDVKEGSRFIQNELTSLGLRWFGGYVTNGILIFLKDEKAPQDLVAFLAKKKIYIRGSFDPPYNNCVRVSIGPKTVMEQFISSLKDWLSLQNQ